MSCNVLPIIKHLKAFCWHLHKENRWVCSIWFWSHFDRNLTTAHKRRSFAGSSCKKKWLNFDTKTADKLLEVLPTYHWTDSLIIESVLLDWGAKEKYLLCFQSIKRFKFHGNLKCKHLFFLFFFVILNDLYAIISVVVSSTLTYFCISSGRLKCLLI